jgi:hypothetical protein
MYRDDGEAMHHRNDALAREVEALKSENLAIREVANAHVPPAHYAAPVPYGPLMYMTDVSVIPLQERARLANHAVRGKFPVWLTGLLNILTFGLFPMIHFGLLHDRLPRASHNDPSSAKAIGFQFIPYFNFYWIFFSALRLADRLNLQLRLRGERKLVSRGLLIAACVLTVIPYINLVIGIPIMWTIASCMLQARVNRIAELDPRDWDARTGLLTDGQYPPR